MSILTTYQPPQEQRRPSSAEHYTIQFAVYTIGCSKGIKDKWHLIRAVYNIKTKIGLLEARSIKCERSWQTLSFFRIIGFITVAFLLYTFSLALILKAALLVTGELLTLHREIVILVLWCLVAGLQCHLSCLFWRHLPPLWWCRVQLHDSSTSVI